MNFSVDFNQFTHFFILGRGHDFQYVGVFHIHVILKNDHTPTQVVDKIFQVVENGQRLLTNQDLLFVDNDIDTLPINIKYSHHALPNGELVRADTPTEPVFEFTQEDLNDHYNKLNLNKTNFDNLSKFVKDFLKEENC